VTVALRCDERAGRPETPGASAPHAMPSVTPPPSRATATWRHRAARPAGRRRRVRLLA